MNVVLDLKKAREQYKEFISWLSIMGQESGAKFRPARDQNPLLITLISSAMKVFLVCGTRPNLMKIAPLASGDAEVR